MANTYTQLYFQIVFAIKNREALIQKVWQEKLHGYITGIVQNHGHKMLSINSMPDHVCQEYCSLFASFHPTFDISFVKPHQAKHPNPLIF